MTGTNPRITVWTFVPVIMQLEYARHCHIPKATSQPPSRLTTKVAWSRVTINSLVSDVEHLLRRPHQTRHDATSTLVNKPVSRWSIVSIRYEAPWCSAPQSPCAVHLQHDMLSTLPARRLPVNHVHSLRPQSSSSVTLNPFTADTVKALHFAVLV